MLTKAETAAIIITAVFILSAAAAMLVFKDSTAVTIEGISPPPEQSQSEDAEKININTATASQLMTLPGIGETLAERIIVLRQEQGGFDCAEEITQVEGIGQDTFEKIKQLITID